MPAPSNLGHHAESGLGGMLELQDEEEEFFSQGEHSFILSLPIE